MHILIVCSNIDSQIGFPHGPMALAPVLEAAGHKVTLLIAHDTMMDDTRPESVAREVVAQSPGLVGFSTFSNQFTYVSKLAQEIRKLSRVPLVCGGIHATMAPRETLETGHFDFIAKGEAEYAMLDLVRALESGGDTSSIPNIWSWRDGVITENKLRGYPKIDGLPPYNYGLLPMQKLINVMNGWVSLLGARGCPLPCGFCFNDQFRKMYEAEAGEGLKQFLRHLNPNEFAEQIAWLLSTYQRITNFIFDDDILTISDAYLKEFMPAYAKATNRFPFVCNAHVKRFSPETAKLLRESGCWMVKMGLESGSKRVRYDIMKRRMTNDDIAESFGVAHEIGIQTSAFAMMGLPHETVPELWETLDLLARVRPSRFRWSVFFPFPGTSLYDLCREEKLIDANKAATLRDFTTDTCLTLPPDVSHAIERLRLFYPWFVNSRMEGPVADQFGPLVNRIMVAERRELASLRNKGNALVEELEKRNSFPPFYVHRYGIMGVRTDQPGI